MRISSGLADHVAGRRGRASRLDAASKVNIEVSVRARRSGGRPECAVRKPQDRSRHPTRLQRHGTRRVAADRPDRRRIAPPSLRSPMTPFRGPPRGDRTGGRPWRQCTAPMPRRAGAASQLLDARRTRIGAAPFEGAPPCHGGRVRLRFRRGTHPVAVVTPLWLAQRGSCGWRAGRCALSLRSLAALQEGTVTLRPAIERTDRSPNRRLPGGRPLDRMRSYVVQSLGSARNRG